MRILAVLLVSLAAWLPQAAIASTLYTNALWWDGTDFVPGDRTVQDGVFVAQGGEPTRSVDLGGAYVIPPLGDAHVHNFDLPDYLAQLTADFVNDGVLYIWNLGAESEQLPAAREALARQHRPAVSFAGPAFTAPGAHAIPYIEAQLQGVQWWSLSPEEKLRVRYAENGEGKRYFAIANPADLDAVWADYLAADPDFVKVILFGSAAGTREDPRAVDEPTLLALAERARAAELPLVIHIETEGDLALALDADVSLLAHAPQYAGPFEPYNAALVERLAQSGAAIAPTFGRLALMEAYVPAEYQMDADQSQRIERAHAARIAQMHSAGVRLVLGSDLIDMTALDEAIYWERIGALSGTDLLNIAVRDTPALLKGRADAGCLSDGCPASFLALPADPRGNMAIIREASHRVFGGAAVANAN